MKRRITGYILYKHRYHLSYLLLIAIGIITIYVTIFHAPNALRQAEIETSLQSSSLSLSTLDPTMFVDLPYHTIQNIGFKIFGVSQFSIKLPSIFLAIMTSIGIFFLTKIWFKKNIAIIVTLLSITTTQFLFMSQDGTPAIMFSFLTIWLLLASTQVCRVHYFSTLWKVITCVLMAISLYSPLGIYLVISLAVTASFHPHIRHTIKKSKPSRMAVAIILSIITVAPLIYATIIKPSVIRDLLGIPSSINIANNTKESFSNVFEFFSVQNSDLLRPIYSIVVIALAIIGIYSMIKIKYTARSYTISILSVIIVTIAFINTQHLSATYPIVVLLMAMGVVKITTSWYELFPFNPYARVAGLIPISILTFGVMTSSIIRYVGNYSHNPDVLSHYTNDIKLLSDINPIGSHKKSIIVADDEKKVYNLLSHFNKNLIVLDGNSNVISNEIIVTNKAKQHVVLPDGYDIQKIITNQKANNSDRFYIYTKAK